MEQVDSKVIKDLALSGKFSLIESKWGAKKLKCSIKYVIGKLEEMDASIEVDGKLSTPFMIGLLQFGKISPEDILQFAESFVTGIGTKYEIPSLPEKTKSNDEIEIYHDLNGEENKLEEQISPQVTEVENYENLHQESQAALKFKENKLKGQIIEKVPNEKKKKRKQKDERDANEINSHQRKKCTEKLKVKRGKTSFVFFAEVTRPEILKENPKISFSDMGKELGNRWKLLSKEDKQLFTDLAKETKESKENNVQDSCSTGKKSHKRKSESSSSESHKKIKCTEPVNMTDNEDLLLVKKKPNEKASYPSESKFLRKGTDVVFVSTPYREFIDSLPKDYFDETEIENFQDVLNLTDSFSMGKIIDLQQMCIPSSKTHKIQNERLWKMDILINNLNYKIIFAPLSSPLLQTDHYLILKDEFENSLKAPWIVNNSQVKKIFVAEDGSGPIWREGSIYFIDSDFKINPFRSILVVWLDQEVGSNDWLYSYEQTDNECSPWELSLTTYVNPEKIKAPTLPSYLTRYVTPTTILEYISNLEFSIYFQKLDEDYIEFFPEDIDQLSLEKIREYIKQNRYTDFENDGFNIFFHDMHRMVTNSKIFNNSNLSLQPWRFADMLEKTLQMIETKLSQQIATNSRFKRKDRESKEKIEVV